MFLSLYLLSSILFSHLIAVNFKKFYFAIFIVALSICLTPSQIDISGTDFAPSIFTFFFNIILEGDYSLRVLRPLVLSTPLSFLVVLIIFSFKKRFFR